MGCDAGADGNTMSIQFPPTEYVAEIGPIEAALIDASVSSRRDWEAVLRGVFEEDFSDSRAMETVVRTSLARIREGFVPLCVMDLYRKEAARAVSE